MVYTLWINVHVCSYLLRVKRGSIEPWGLILGRRKSNMYFGESLRKHDTKNLKFQIKILIFFYISAQNIDCGYSLEPPRRGGSNEYPQSMFLSRNKKNNVYPCKPQFYWIKVGFKGVKIIMACFRDGCIGRDMALGRR